MNATMEAPSVDARDEIEIEYDQTARTETTLFELIAALQDEAEAGDDATVIAAVTHLSRTGRIRRRLPVGGHN